MFDELGPREIIYVDEAGNEGSVLIALRSRGKRRTDLGDGTFLDEVVGVVVIASKPITHEIELTGTDEVQLVFRLLWMADIYIQTRFRERGMDIYKNVRGDVNRAFGVYN